MTSTWTLDRAVIGPYIRPSSRVRATSVPSWIAPCTTRLPPTPYTAAVASEASRLSAMNSVLP